MDFGLEVIPFGEFSNPRTVMQVAQAAETAGWEAIWVWDHLVFPWPVGDPWVTLSAVATATSRLKLVTGVSPLPRYRPHLLARMLTALDILSEGRVIFGTGLGIPSDFVPFGEPEEAKVRAAMTDEGLALLAQWWSGVEVSHRGEHYRSDGVRMLPTPVQQPRLPVWIGGDSNAALRRAARWDGWIMGVINEQGEIIKPPSQLARQVEYIRQHRADDAPFEVAIDGVSAAGDRGALAREFADAGATWWFEGIYGSRGSLAELLARVKAGPPR